MIRKWHIFESKAVGRLAGGFTLVELLTVIAIIGIIAGMVLVVINNVPNSARKTEARLEIKGIETAISDYESVYSHFPVSTAVQQSGLASVTYGGVFNNGAGSQWPPAPAPANYQSSNSEVISILIDATNFPGGGPTVNTNYQKNAQQRIFLNAKAVSDASSPGIGTDLNYRDPWGNPYVISIDLNADDKCEDAFYGSAAVSAGSGAGLDGLTLQPDGNYALRGNIMVWSMGPNGPFYHSPSSFNASAPATDTSNKNHVLSWQ